METLNINKYTELEKERKNMDKIRVLTEFFEWSEDMGYEFGVESDWGVKNCNSSSEELIYKFLGIDLVRLKLERQFSLKEYKQ